MVPTATPGSIVAQISARGGIALCAAVAVWTPGCAGSNATTAAGAAEGEDWPDDRRGQDDTTTADKHYQVALASFHNGMYEDAKLQLRRALQSNAAHPESLYLQGIIHLNEGRTIVDAVEMQRCLRDEAADQQRRRAEASHRKAHEFFGRAADAFEEGSAGRGRAKNSMAVVSLFFHDYEQAQKEARGALDNQFYTERYSALSNLGWAYYEEGKLIEATTELRQAVMLNPDYCVGHYRLAQVYLETGLVDEAVEQANLVLTSDRCPIQDVHRVLGVAHLRLGADGDAQEFFETCVDLAPRSCLALDCQAFIGGTGAARLTRASEGRPGDAARESGEKSGP